MITAHLISVVVATPVAGRLGDMFGKRRVLLVTLAALAAGSLAAALADSLGTLVAARVVQGIGGATFPLAFGIVRDELAYERVPRGIATVSSTLGVGGALGIVAAGPLVDHLGLAWLFWLPLIVAVIASIAVVVGVSESPVGVPGRVDWAGALLLCGWLACALLAISEGPRHGWGGLPTLLLLAAAAGLLAAWVWTESRSRLPLVDIRVLRLRSVWTTNLTAFLLGFAMFSSFLVIPQFVAAPSSSGVGFGTSVTGTGLFLLPAALGMLAFSTVAGGIAAPDGARRLVILGSAVASGAFALLTFVHGEPWHVYAATALMGVGMGFAYPSMTTLIVRTVPQEQTGVATGLNTIVRTIGGSIGSQIGATVIAATAVAGTPRERGFTITFALCTVVLAGSVVAALAVPRRSGDHVARSVQRLPA